MTLARMENVVRAKRPKRLPTVLSVIEVRTLLAALDGRAWLIASLLYGTGMRLMECLRLRVKDADFMRNEIVVRNGKGGKGRRTVPLRTLVEPLQREIDRARTLHAADVAAGDGRTRLPHALARKCPMAGAELGWQYVFASPRCSLDPRDGRLRRHHFGEEVLSRALKTASRRIGQVKPVTAQVFRHTSVGSRLRRAHHA